MCVTYDDLDLVFQSDEKSEEEIDLEAIIDEILGDA